MKFNTARLLLITLAIHNINSMESELKSYNELDFEFMSNQELLNLDKTIIDAKSLDLLLEIVQNRISFLDERSYEIDRSITQINQPVMQSIITIEPPNLQQASIFGQAENKSFLQSASAALGLTAFYNSTRKTKLALFITIGAGVYIYKKYLSKISKKKDNKNKEVKS